MAILQPYAAGVIEEHREAGRAVVDGDHQPGARSSPRSPSGSGWTP